MEAAGTPGRLLVVDDEKTILELLSGSLRLAGFEVTTAASGAEAVRAAASRRPDLVLLDVMMPDGDGFEALRRMRSAGIEVPVIFLTARDEEPDRVNGFDLGADDYVTKPFSLNELLGRIRAVLRRSRPGDPGSRLCVADLELDEDAHEVKRAGAVIDLTPTEYRLLRFLMLNPAESSARTRSWITSGKATPPATATWSSRASATCGARLTRDISSG